MLKLELRRQAKGKINNLVDNVYYTPRRSESKDSRFKRSIKSALRNSTTNLEDFDVSGDNRLRFSAFISEN